MRHTILVLAFFVGSCAESIEAGARRIKLADRTSGQLTTAPDPFVEEVLLNESFASGTEDWSVLVDSANPLREDPELLSFEAGSEDGHTFVSLHGQRGALYRILEVEPSTPYRFHASVRSRGIVPMTEPFFGAAPSLAELSDFGPVQELLERGIEDLIVRRELFLTTYREEGWREHERWFRTGPNTRALLIVCALGLTEDTSAGRVDFADVELRRVSDRSLQGDLLATDVKTFGLGEPMLEGWHAERRVKALLGTELRPSIVLFPGESLRFEVTLPGRRPLFEAGIGPWRPALQDALARNRGSAAPPPTQTFRVRLDGEEILTVEQPASAQLVETRWQEVSADLRRWSGKTVTLELFVDGDLPGVFGAPLLRPAEPEAAMRGAVERPNLLLVSIDTLRADHLGCYGYGEDTTPRIDAFASEAIRFDHVVSQSPYTLPSHTSMFSGQFSSVHGIQRGGQVISTQRSPLIARILSDQGYRTQAFTGGGFLSSVFGFDKGFDGFVNIDPLRQRDSAYLANLAKKEPERYSQALIQENGPEAVKSWMTEHEDEPFFLFLHTYTVHDYDPPADYVRCEERGCEHKAANWHEFRLRVSTGWTPYEHTEEDRAHLNHSYDDSLRYVDHLIGDILDHLDTLRLRERTIVAITTDHGEELLERGFVQHGKTLYEEVTRIPMILRIPGESARVDRRSIMQIDLMPTLLGALGLPADSRSQGVDLLRTEAVPDSTWSEIHDSFAHRYTLRSADGLKIIHSPPDDTIALPNLIEWELYDLKRDAGELENRAEPGTEPFESMRALLEARREALSALEGIVGEVGTSEIDADTLMQLEALGYL